MSHKSRCLEGGCELQTKGCGALKHRHINTHMQDWDFHMGSPNTDGHYCTQACMCQNRDFESHIS